MPIFLETLTLTPENVTGDVDYLKGNIFQQVTLEARVRVQTWINALVDEEIQFADPFYTTTDWVTDNTVGGRFANFNVGDTIVITGAASVGNNGTYTILEKLSDSVIRLNAGMTQSLDNSCTIKLNQRPKGVTYDYGLIPNSAAISFNSLVDGVPRGSLMRYEFGTATTIPSIYTPMTAVGKRSWQIGLGGEGAEVKDVSSAEDLTAFTYVLEIRQVFYIHLFYLPDQIRLLQLTPPRSPFYYRLQEALKHTFRVRAYRELQDPNVFQELAFDDKIGNTGWFDEEYNGGNAQYEIQNLAFSNSVGLTRDDTVTVTFDVVNTTFNTEGNAKYVCVSFIMLPEDPLTIQDNMNFQYQNFCFDRANQEEGAAAINGLNNLTGYQVIQDLTVTNGASKVEVSFDVNFGADVQAFIDGLSNKRYLLAAYAVADLQTAEDANYVTMLADFGEIEVNIPDATFDVTTELFFHDQNLFTSAVTSPTFQVEAEVVAESLILLDQGSFTDAQIDSLSIQLVAKKTGEEAILQEFDVDFSQLPEIGGVRFISQTQQTPFNVNATEIRKELKVYRSTADDTGTQKAYRVQYPFLIRWEDWEQLFLASLPSDFLDPLENFNGYNHEWLRLDGLSGWSIAYRIQGVVSAQNVQKTITDDTTLSLQDYVSNSNWSNEAISCLDGATNLAISGTPYILDPSAQKNTTVRAQFTWAGSAGSAPAANDVYVVFRIIPKGNGTYIANDSFSSVWNRDSVSMFTSATGLATIQKSGLNYTAECQIDYTKIPQGVTEFTISASICIKSSVPPADWGEIVKQDVTVQEELVFTAPSAPINANPFKKCCYDLKVFADLTDTDELKNDRSPIWKIIPKQYTITMKLQKLVSGTWTDQATLTAANTYGTHYAQGFAEKGNNSYIGYDVSWRLVLASFGTGKYRVAFESGSDAIYSEDYCLDFYSAIAIDETVRIKYLWNSVIGDSAQSKTRDFAGLNLWNQIRLKRSIFGYKSGGFETEEMRYQNGRNRTVQKRYAEEYQMIIKELPVELHDVVVNDILMADEIKITDYNSRNAGRFVDQVVEVQGGYEPNYANARPYPDVTVNLKDAFDNRRKLYS